MLIDVFFLIFMGIAVIKGIRRGFIIAVFSIIAIIIGLAAAMKLSSAAAVYWMDTVNITARWLPFISFILVFMLVVFLVRLVARIISKTVEMAFLGWFNRLAGVILYILLYSVIFSLFLFFAVQLQLFKENTIAQSVIYPWVEPLGPYVINGIGEFIPFFQNMFQHLKEFFDHVSKQIPD